MIGAGAVAEKHVERRLAVVLHDVAPARWDACRRVLDEIAAVARRAGVTVPVTLLVVPRLHGDAAAPPLYLDWLRGLVAAGHELALHGLTHLDPGTPSGPIDRLRRRVYTAGEGEFAALSPADAQQRLAQARRWAAAHALPMRGFVAPAWLMNDAARAAVAAAGFEFTCTIGRIVALPGGATQRCQALTFSTRSAWRRGLSIVWNRTLAALQHGAPLLRLELHPHDADHAAVRRCWTRLLADALEQREPLRIGEAAALARDAAAASDPLGAATAPAQPRTALVAGAAGLIGSHLCERLLGAGWTVIGIDNLSTGSPENVAALQAEPGFSFLRHDITEPLPPELNGFPRIDRIVNLACPASPPFCRQHPIDTLLASTHGTWRLLELAARCGARLLQASSGPSDADPSRPHAGRDAGPRCAEALCRAYRRERGVEVRIARLFDGYGPRVRADDGRVVGTFVTQALAGKPLTVHGDGRQSRSFCYVDDAVLGLLALLESSLDEPVDIGGGADFSVMELAERVIALTGSRSRIDHAPLPADDPAPRRPDIDLARRELAWSPVVTLDDGLQRTIAWFRALALQEAVR